MPGAVSSQSVFLILLSLGPGRLFGPLAKRGQVKNVRPVYVILESGRGVPFSSLPFLERARAPLAAALVSYHACSRPIRFT